jgi:hypothetical protein
MSDPGSLLGRHVTIRGGMEDGLTGYVVANEPDRTRSNPYGTDRPYRWRVWLDGAYLNDGLDAPATIGGLHPIDVDPDLCPYCGAGWCQGTASTANGRDLERFDAVHGPGRYVVAQWHAKGSPK